MAARLALAHLAGIAALAATFAVDFEAEFAALAGGSILASSQAVADDFGFFFLIGAAASLPVLAVVVFLVLIFADWVEDNLLAFVLGGPVVVCLGWFVIAGTNGLAGVGLATGTASLVFALLGLFGWPRTHRNPT